MSRLTALASLVFVLAACGGDKKAAPGKGSGSGSGSAPAAAPLTLPADGVEAVKLFNYSYGPGAKDYDKVVALYKASPRDWAAIKTAAEAVLAKDADHLDARWALGEALANTGDAQHAAEALLVALGADWLRWGPGLEKDPDLKAFLATPQGEELVTASGTIGAEWDEAIAKDPLVLARRSGWKLPAPGTSYAATRGELYAYDLDKKRYLRLTHTDHSLAGFLRSPSGELLLVGYTQAQVPDPTKLPAGGAHTAAAAPILTRAWVSAWDPKDHATPAVLVAVPKARAITAGYGDGDQVIVTTAPATSRWATGPATAYSLDRGAGKLTKAPHMEVPTTYLQLTLDDVVVVRPGGWPDKLEDSTRRDIASLVMVDDKNVPQLEMQSMSPGGGNYAFATTTDPCKDEEERAQPSLYSIETQLGQYKHVLTAASRFRVEWIDDDRFLYEDGSGGLRIYEATAHREVGKLTERAGLALETLPPSKGPLCQTEPPVSDPTATDDDLPPEEGSAAGTGAGSGAGSGAAAGSAAGPATTPDPAAPATTP
ncbi:MAG TPA: hypothetical protein VHE35_26530 [Kofleriaceae bacterium]|nr:hypothetical protein [Kofleriaceae bacterium]